MSQPSWAAWIEIIMVFSTGTPLVSQPSWAAWIEIATLLSANLNAFMSQPSWAAWIEIIMVFSTGTPLVSRSPHGLRGLKFQKTHKH